MIFVVDLFKGNTRTRNENEAKDIPPRGQWTDHNEDRDSLGGGREGGRRKCPSSSILFFHQSNIDNSFHFGFSLLKYESRSIVV